MRNKAASRPDLVGLFSLELWANGQQVPEVEFDGRTIAVAPWDTEFEIVVRATREPSTDRIPKDWAVKLSVDSQDPTGGGVKKLENCGGFIVGAFPLKLRGFILPPDKQGPNKDAIARFKFGRREDSYATAMGVDQANIGVIGIAVYEGFIPAPELPPIVFEPSYDDIFGATKGGGGGGYTMGGAMKGGGGSYGGGGTLGGGTRRKSAGPLAASGGGGHTHSLGVEFGRKDKQKFDTKPFNLTSNTPVWIGQLEFMTPEDLDHNGIERPANLPNAFPLNQGCTLPPGWTGE